MVAVTVDGQTSPPVPFPYDGPRLLSVDPPMLDAVLAPPSTQRARLSITGVNFGVRYRDGVASDHRVTVGNATCGGVVWDSDGLVSCLLGGDHTVGTYSVTVVVGGRPSAPPLTLWLKCPKGRFGQVGEACAACPSGAACPGLDADPVRCRVARCCRSERGGVCMCV